MLSAQNLKEVEILVNAREKLRDALRKHEALFSALERPMHIELDKFVEFADFITDTISAPDGWKEGFPLVRSHPPVPQPDQMRRGKLAEYATGRDFGLGDNAPSRSDEVGRSADAPVMDVVENEAKGDDPSVAQNEAKEGSYSSAAIPRAEASVLAPAGKLAMPREKPKLNLNFGMDSGSDSD